MTDIAWGVIGSSGFAANVSAPAIVAAEGAALLGVHGSKSGDFNAFVNNPELDAVWIVTPTHMHKAMALAAIAAGKHVLVEKPLAMRPADAWEMVEAARAADVVFATGYQARYVPGHVAMRDLIDQGAIGDVSLARSFWGINRTSPPQAWRQSIDEARWGVLGDIGTHHVDILRMLLGEITTASAFVGHDMGFETENVAAANLRFASGVLGSLTVSARVADAPPTIEVFGSEGVLVASGTFPQGQGTVELRRPGQSPELLAPTTDPSPVAQVATLNRVINGEPLAYATGEDGARNLEVLEQMLAP